MTKAQENKIRVAVYGRAEKSERRGSVRVQRGCSAQASVRLSVANWNDLVNFVVGDLHNMPSDDETRQQMERILDAIRLACMKAPNK